MITITGAAPYCTAVSMVCICIANPPSEHTPTAGRSGWTICAVSVAGRDQLTPPMPPDPK